jgi:hypothetical protein
MNKTKIESFSNLTFYPMTVPNVGCIATGTLASGYDITVTGGNNGQAADGVNTFLVEVVGNNTEPPRVVVKKNMEPGEIALLIEHHRRNSLRKKRRR